MLGRLFILMTAMLFGPLFIEVYLYHPMIVLEHDYAALVPLVASPLAVFAGFLLLAADNRATAALFAIVCALELMVGVAGSAIHIALHRPDTLISLVTDPHIWHGQPPPLVPVTFSASGCLGLIPLAWPGMRMLEEPPLAIARILAAMAAVSGLIGTVAAALPAGGTIALFAIITALGLGAFGYLAEVMALIGRTLRHSYGQ
jgi:hypothetical protein